jgi:hypothetical protein
MAKSPVLDQIKELKERNAVGQNLFLFERLDHIDRILQEIKPKNITNTDAIYQYIPLATVACTEGYFRYITKHIIDSGSPFIEKVPELEKRFQLKITLDIIVEIQSQSLTVGELVAHVLPCNRLEDIDATLSILLGKSFLDTIKTHNRPDGLVNQENQKKFNEDYAQVFGDIKRIFELRHILAHEIASNVKVDKEEILRCYNNTKSFLTQCIDFIFYSMDPDKPSSTEGIVERERSRAEQIEKELEELLSQKTYISQFLTPVQPVFNQTRKATVKAWKSYREARAKHAATTIATPIYSELSYLQNYVETTRRMIEELKKVDHLY